MTVLTKAQRQFQMVKLKVLNLNHTATLCGVSLTLRAEILLFLHFSLSVMLESQKKIVKRKNVTAKFTRTQQVRFAACNQGDVPQ